MCVGRHSNKKKEPRENSQSVLDDEQSKALSEDRLRGKNATAKHRGLDQPARPRAQDRDEDSRAEHRQSAFPCLAAARHEDEKEMSQSK